MQKRVLETLTKAETVPTDRTYPVGVGGRILEI